MTTAAKTKSTYIVDGNLTDDAILTNDLLKAVGINVTGKRELPKDGTLKLKDPEHFDYHTRNLKFHYPGSGDHNGIVIPDVAIYNETFDHFGKTGVYIGVPLWIREGLLNKLKSNGFNAVTEEVGISNDEKYWWMKKGFATADKEKEYISINDDEGEEYYESWVEYFKDYPTPSVANMTCTITLSCSTPVGTGVKGNEVWKMSLTPYMFNMVDAIDIEKPKGSIIPKRMPGKKDKMRAGLKARCARVD
ncbi:hypothetical protein CNMCM6457_005866 [Aspergillus fumigatiaffinis]|nr:hypothetical protein CNMCM6457_005866 [Aspergillus fumigatiaffinis]